MKRFLRRSLVFSKHQRCFSALKSDPYVHARNPTAVERLSVKIECKDMLDEHVTTVNAGDTVRTAANKMVLSSSDFALVCSGEDIKGSFSSSSLIDKVVLTGRSLDTSVDQVMEIDFPSLTRQDRLWDCVELMRQRGTRHIPIFLWNDPSVVNNIYGIRGLITLERVCFELKQICERDSELSQLLIQDVLEDLCFHHPVFDPKSSILVALETLKRQCFDPVMPGGLTRRDSSDRGSGVFHTGLYLSQVYGAGINPQYTMVQDLQELPAPAISPSYTVAQAFDLLARTHGPVLVTCELGDACDHDSRCMGILSFNDLMLVLTDPMYNRVLSRSLQRQKHG